MIKDDPELNALIDRAMTAFYRLTQKDEAAHRREQTISFVYSNLRLSGRAITQEQIADIYDELHAPISGVIPKQSG